MQERHNVYYFPFQNENKQTPLVQKSKAAILAEVKERDDRDINRENAPLKPAENALLLDTSKLDIDAVFSRAVDLVRQNYQPQ